MKLAKINPDKIEGGDWVGDIPEMGDLRLKTRGIGNAKFRSLQQELIGAFPRGKRVKGRVPAAEMDKITATCLLRTTLLDWDNLEGDDGQPEPYSEERARLYLTDPAYRPFFDAAVYAATVVGEDEAEAAKVDEGNSQATAAGI